MMFVSMGAFAQNNEPLEGDVNNDGTVDVADIVGIIKIMKDGGGAVGEKMCYWYSGTNNGNAVTADNFTDVASRIPESEVPETGSVTANGQYVYFVMPETKHLESLTDGNGSAVEFTSTDIMGYHIYKTAGMISGMTNYTIEQTIYYWYVGQTDPSTMTEISPIVDNNDTSSPGWRRIGNSLPEYSSSNMLWNGDNNNIIFENRDFYYIAVPSESIKIYNAANGSVMDSFTNITTKDIGGVLYYIYPCNSKARSFGYNIF